MGASAFLYGFASRVTNPLATIWFTDLVIALICFFYLVSKKSLVGLFNDFRSNRDLVLTMSVFDNLAWIAFGFAALYVPIAIVMALSESYIALAALLGLLVNKERLITHQKVGMGLALFAAIALSTVAG